VFNQLQEQYWTNFITQSFPGIPLEISSGMNSFDMLLIMMNQADPVLYSQALGLQNSCNNFRNITCFEVLLNPIVINETIKEMSKSVNYSRCQCYL